RGYAAASRARDRRRMGRGRADDDRACARAPPRFLRELAADGRGDRLVALDARVPPLLGLPRGHVPGVGLAGAVPPELRPPRRRAVDSPPLGGVAGVRKAEEP